MANSEKQRLKRKHKLRQNATGAGLGSYSAYPRLWEKLPCPGCGATIEQQGSRNCDAWRENP